MAFIALKFSILMIAKFIIFSVPKFSNMILFADTKNHVVLFNIKG